MTDTTPTPTMLRTVLLTPLPDLTEPTFFGEPGSYEPNPTHTNYSQMIRDAANWTARLYGTTIADYISDSTIDSHNAMLATLTNLHNLAYGHDQTMSDIDALNAFLDNADAYTDIVETASPNTGMPDDMKDTLPALFSHFDLTYDRYFELTD